MEIGVDRLLKSLPLFNKDGSFCIRPPKWLKALLAAESKSTGKDMSEIAIECIVSVLAQNPEHKRTIEAVILADPILGPIFRPPAQPGKDAKGNKPRRRKPKHAGHELD